MRENSRAIRRDSCGWIHEECKILVIIIYQTQRWPL